MTNDGKKKYNYDEENRLVKVTRKSDGQVLIENQYDALGRRVVKKANGKETRFLYHKAGFLILAELNTANQVEKSYVWGADLANSKEVAGGIGGLVAITNHVTNKTFYPLYDTMGNVIGLVEAGSGALVATYRYSPYGKLLEASGSAVEECPFRFSTKYLDKETGLYYYGFRYYSPELGRWLTRDPLGEMGGVNLYEFLGNPVNFIDPYGLDGISGSIWLRQNLGADIPLASLPPLISPQTRADVSVWLANRVYNQAYILSIPARYVGSFGAGFLQGMTVNAPQWPDISDEFESRTFQVGKVYGNIGISLLSLGITGCPRGNKPLSTVRIATENLYEGEQLNFRLNKYQQKLLELLPTSGSSIIVPKNAIKLKDLGILTTATRSQTKLPDEFVMFTLGSRRLVMRLGPSGGQLEELFPQLIEQGWRWSGHSHPGIWPPRTVLQPSGADIETLQIFNQRRSAIVSEGCSIGVFNVEGNFNIVDPGMLFR